MATAKNRTSRATDLMISGACAETLENRILFTKWEGVGNYSFRNDTPAVTIGGITPGQKIQVIGLFQDDEVSTYQQARILAGGGTLSLNSTNYGGERTFFATGSSFSIDAVIDDESSGDRVLVSVAKQRLADLDATAPQLMGDGSIRYGYQIYGDVAVEYRDWVEVELYYADVNSVPLLKIAGHNLKANPGEGETFTVPSDAVPPPPVGTKKLIAWIDRYDKAAEYDESRGDNLKSIGLANIIAQAPVQTGSSSVTIGYTVENPPFVVDGVANVRLYWAKGPAWEERLSDVPVFESPMDAGMNGAAARIEVPSSSLASPPVGATHLLTNVDRFNRIRETNESDNTSALALPDFSIEWARWETDGGITVRTRNDGSRDSVILAPMVSAYWSADGSFTSDDVRATSFKADVANQVGGRNIRLMPASLGRPPSVGLKYLLLRIDDTGAVVGGNGAVVERIESNNVNTLRVSQPTFRIKSIRLDQGGKKNSNGKTLIEYALTSGQLVEGSKPRVNVYWIDWLGNELGQPIKSVAAKISGTVTLGIAELDEPPAGADSLLVTIEDGASILTAINTRVGLDTALSAELKLAPLSVSRYARVRQFLAWKAPSIQRWAGIFNVPQEAIAGAIAWEGLQNRTIASSVGIGSFSSPGIGKPHASDKSLQRIEGDAGFKLYGKFVIPPQSNRIARYLAMQDDDVSIMYIAGLMNGYAVEAEKAGIKNLRKNPWALCTYYNGTKGQFGATRNINLSSAGAYFKQVRASGRQFAPGAWMGQWVKNNMGYLRDALRSDPFPAEFAAEAAIAPVDDSIPDFSFIDSISASAVGEKVTVRWDHTNVVPTYELMMSSDKRNWTTTGETGGVGRELTITTSRHTTWFFAVFGVGDDGQVLAGSEVAVLDAVTVPRAPTNPRVSAIGGSSFTLSWDDNSEEKLFEVWIAKGNGSFQLSEIVPPNRTSAVIEYEIRNGATLKPNTDYRVKLRAVGTNGEPSAFTQERGVRTLPGAPAKPGNLRVLAVFPEAADLAWDEVVGESSYTIRVSTDGGISWRTQENVPADHAYRATVNLQPGRSYWFTVVANSSSGVSDPSNAVQVNTPKGTASAPSNLRILSVGPTSADLAWNEVTGESSYAIEVSTDGGNNWGLQENVPADHAYKASVTLQPGRIYWFRVVAKNNYGSSDPSNVVQVTTPKGTLAAPTNLRVLSIGPTSADLAFDELSGELSYTLQVSTDGGSSWSTQENVPADHAYKVTATLQAGRTYWFRVVANNVFGASGPSNVVQLSTPRGITSAPGNLRIINVSPTSADLAWDEVTSETSYTIQGSTNGGGSWTVQENVPADHAYRATVSLQPGQAYWFRVVANNAYGASDPSNVVQLSTPRGTLAAPSNLRVTGIGVTSADLAWDEVSGESSYTIFVSTNGGGTWRVQENVPADHAHRATVTLQAGQSYHFYVVANNGFGASDPSNVVQLTTSRGTPAAPTNLRATGVRSTEIDLAWNEVSGEDSYTIQVSNDGGSTWRTQENVPANHAYKATVSVQANRTYWFRVVARNSYGVSDPSNVLKVTTPR